MKAYFIERLKQGSTWVGILTAVVAVISSGGTLTPALVTTVLTAIGLFHVNA